MIVLIAMIANDITIPTANIFFNNNSHKTTTAI